MKAVGIIPVRLESSRLPHKAIQDICGLPMFVHTVQRAKLATSLSDVYLATDNKKLIDIADSYGIKSIMTKTTHKNGSERIAEACDKIEQDVDIIVNIQGDEPLLYPEHIDKIVKPLIDDSSVQVSIGVTKYHKRNSLSDIKAVLDLNQDILYCSRNDLPCYYLKDFVNLWKLCFIVPHRKKWIKKYLEWKAAPLEIIEDNHFLRLIENGIKIRAVEIEGAKISVDTQEDLIEIRKLMQNDTVKYNYMRDK